jgi:glutamate-ammonia-ligase adenylyltransferase
MPALFTNLETLPESPPESVAAHLSQQGFKDPKRTWAMVRQLDQRLVSRFASTHPVSALLEAAAASYDPDRAFNNLYSLYPQVEDEHTRTFLNLITHPSDARDALTAICAGSQPLSALLIQNPGFLRDVFSNTSWQHLKPRDQLQQELTGRLINLASVEEAMGQLRAFKKQEYLRIAVADLMRQSDTPTILQRLSDVADLCLQGAYEVATRHLERKHGKPRLNETQPSGFAIIGMGKLGGSELNFSSDIDLMYVYDSTEGRTTESHLSTYEYYPKLARLITDMISRITTDGLTFRVDLRLRPEGRAGDIANSVDGYRWHYESHGQMWERQALLKARVCAGCMTVGDQFTKAIRDLVFHPTFDPLILDDIHHMREKIARALIERGSNDYHVKLGTGGIREIEFIVQGFQLVYGGMQGWPWERGTLKTLAWITDQGYLTDDESADLSAAYLFLRDLENRIQMTSDHQTHVIPIESHAQTVLARMMGLSAETEEASAHLLLSWYRKHTTAVRSIYERVFHSAM